MDKTGKNKYEENYKVGMSSKESIIPIPPNQEDAKNPQRQQPTIDQQVSILLGPLNRANNHVAREAESAVLQVISQLVVLKDAFDKLQKEFQDLKDELAKKAVKNLPTSSNRQNPPSQK